MNNVVVRPTTAADFQQIIELTKAVYPNSPTWTKEQLQSHLSIFPDGQFVAWSEETKMVVGYAASLIFLWDDYEMENSWRDFTAGGMFTNHDPINGKTLYGAEIMVHPKYQGKGIGGELYRLRRELAKKLGLLRIRAGARLRGYHEHASKMTAEEYVLKVVKKELYDSTLSFQLKQEFHVLAVVSNYLRFDSESLGFAAVIEWLNEEVAKPEHYEPRRKSMFYVEN